MKGRIDCKLKWIKDRQSLVVSRHDHVHIELDVKANMRRRVKKLTGWQITNVIQKKADI